MIGDGVNWFVHWEQYFRSELKVGLESLAAVLCPSKQQCWWSQRKRKTSLRALGGRRLACGFEPRLATTSRPRTSLDFFLFKTNCRCEWRYREKIYADGRIDILKTMDHLCCIVLLVCLAGLPGSLTSNQAVNVHYLKMAFGSNSSNGM